jgi:hypothetical protein
MGNILLGNTQITDIKIGNTRVQQVYKGENLIWQNGKFQYRRSFTVTSSASQTGYLLTLFIHRASGTDDFRNLYLGTSPKADFSDIRFTNAAGDKLPFAVVDEPSSVTRQLILKVNLSAGSNTLYCYFNRVRQKTYKIAYCTDVHKDTDTYANRHLADTYLANFVTRMQTYLPDLAVLCGDITGASSSVQATQQGWYETMLSIMDTVAPYAGRVEKGVAHGNHDFEYMSFAYVLGKHQESWRQSGTLYGQFDHGGFTHIVLDANYVASGETHHSLTHSGNGYINATQVTWLTAALSAATLPVIVWCHQGLSEEETTQITLTKALYHVDNRAAIRTLLENSGKVVCVLTGHKHWFRAEAIKGIAYLSGEDLNEVTGLDNEAPTGTIGKWNLVEIDTENKVINFKCEAKIGSAYHTLYEFKYGYKTAFDTDVSRHAAETFALSYAAEFGKSGMLLDATDLRINNASYIFTQPANRYLSEPELLRTIKVTGRTASPNFGRAYYSFPQTTGLMKIKFRARVSALATAYFKFGSQDSTSNLVLYTGFKSNGQIFSGSSTIITDRQAYAINTWYSFIFIVYPSTKTFDMYVDGTLRVANAAYYNASATYVKEFELTTEINNVFIDSMRIEPYVSPEPTLTAWAAIENL